MNAPPHIGFALEVIQADTIARYRRQLGDVVFFATGTDEHGAKIARAAEERGKSPQEFARKNSNAFKELKKALNLSWDVFIRTSDKKKHWPVIADVWNTLYKRGDLYRKTYEGLYCVGHESFITEKDMRDGACVIHKIKPEHIREENWFFRLSKYLPRIKKLLEKGTLRVLPENRKHEILALIAEKSEDVSFSRPRKDLSWGIPVPGDSTQTVYVWADALVNYLSALDWRNKKSPLRKFWPADVHIIGKDILRFHALFWPAMLLSAGLKIPKLLFVHGFVTVGGEKMSKSLGNVIDPRDLSKTYGTDALRYFLLREIPAGEDGDFSGEKFEARYTGDLAHGLGNLIARVSALGERVSPLKYAPRDVPGEIKKEIKTRERRFHGFMKDFRLNEALAETWQLIGFADRLVSEKKPWSISDRKELSRVLINAAHIILSIEALVRPFLPETAEHIRKQFSLRRGKLTIKKGAALFPRLHSS